MSSTMKKRVLGFTLIELMVVVSIMVILVAIAAPSFQETLRRNAIDSQQRDLMSALNQARQEAMTRNARISICRSTDQVSCDTSVGSWGVGWIIFIDSNTAGVFDAGDQYIAKHGALKQNIAIRLLDSGGIDRLFLQFSASGSLSSSSIVQSGTFVICPSNNSALDARGILINSAGRPLQSPRNSVGAYLDINDAALTCP